MDQASFKFENYKILQFSFNSNNIRVDDIALKLDPSGTFVRNGRKYILEIHFYAFGKDNTIESNFVECKLSAEFNFSEHVNEIVDIPTYFYANSIAIVFPYLRAFISSLTIQANLKPLILPTMNLSSLSNPLKEHTITID